MSAALARYNESSVLRFCNVTASKKGITARQSSVAASGCICTAFLGLKTLASLNTAIELLRQGRRNRGGHRGQGPPYFLRASVSGC